MTMAEICNPDEYKALLRADFASFAVHCFRELNPRTPFLLSWHQELIAAKLEAVRQSRNRLNPLIALNRTVTAITR